MCAAIDATLGAISSGTVHSRVGACDPPGLFAKRVLNGDSHHALVIASLAIYPEKPNLWWNRHVIQAETDQALFTAAERLW